MATSGHPSPPIVHHTTCGEAEVATSCHGPVATRDEIAQSHAVDHRPADL